MSAKWKIRILTYMCLLLLISGGLIYIARVNIAPTGFSTGPRTHKATTEKRIGDVDIGKEMRGISAPGDFDIEISGHMADGASISEEFSSKISGLVNKIGTVQNIYNIETEEGRRRSGYMDMREEPPPEAYTEDWENYDFSRMSRGWEIPDIPSEAQEQEQFENAKVYYRQYWAEAPQSINFQNVHGEYEWACNKIYDEGLSRYRFIFDAAEVSGEKITMSVFHSEYVSGNRDANQPQVIFLIAPHVGCDYPNLRSARYNERSTKLKLQRNNWTIDSVSSISLWQILKFFTTLKVPYYDNGNNPGYGYGYGGLGINRDYKIRVNKGSAGMGLERLWSFQLRENDIFYKDTRNSKVVFGKLVSIRKLEERLVTKPTRKGRKILRRRDIIENFPWYIKDLEVDKIIYLLSDSDCAANWQPCYCDNYDSYTSNYHTLWYPDNYHDDPCYDLWQSGADPSSDIPDC